MLFAGKDSQHNMQPPDTQRFPGDKNQDGMPLVPAKSVMQATEDTENASTSTEGITEPGCCAPLLRGLTHIVLSVFLLRLLSAYNQCRFRN